MKKKQVQLGFAIRGAAARDPAFGRRIDKLPHHSAARNAMAKRFGKKAKKK